MVVLEVQRVMGSWKTLGKGKTNMDGRCDELLLQGFRLQAGAYRLNFDTAAYFRQPNVTAFYPEISIVFMVRETDRNYHIPLVLSPFGYSTYRGS